MPGSKNRELCVATIVNSESSCEEIVRTFDNSTQPQVCLFGPGPISTYCCYSPISGDNKWRHLLGTRT